MSQSRPSPAIEVAAAFLKLGVSSFGGPVAHIGYFRAEFVQARAWLDDKTYADLVALCQFLPGPASSQVAFALGLMRAGITGAAAAWIAFTTPSALLLILFAAALQSDVAAFNGPIAVAVVHGLKLAAVPVIAQAVWNMARSLCPDLTRALIALACGIMMFFVAGGFAQLAAILVGALAGLALCRAPGNDSASPLEVPVSRRAAAACLAAFFILLAALPLARSLSPALALSDAMYRSGALVFGGGHVVLPLLREAVVTPGWMSDATFLAGYGAAQAVPGPLFSFAAFIGQLAHPDGAAGGLTSALLALVMIFLPGMLILCGVLPYWGALRALPAAQGVVRGVNAGVVGILAAALYRPVAVTAITSWVDAAIAAFGIVLFVLRRPPWLVVAFTVLASLVASLLR